MMQSLPGSEDRLGVLASDNMEDRLDDFPANTDIRWQYRQGRSPVASEDLVSAVPRLSLPDGDTVAYVAGEAKTCQMIRDHLLKERGWETGMLKSPAGGRRERMRENTINEMLHVAREILASEGVEAVTNPAIARRMGLTTPAIYRYYLSHHELIAALSARLYGELTRTMTAAKLECDPAHPTAPLLAMCRAMRPWSTRFPAEFRLLFARRSPLETDAEAGEAFGGAFLDEVALIWKRKPFDTPDLENLSDTLSNQLRAYSRETDERLPPGAVYVFLSGWVRLYGVLSMEVHQLLAFALEDVGPFYERQLQELCETLGVEYLPLTRMISSRSKAIAQTSACVSTTVPRPHTLRRTLEVPAVGQAGEPLEGLDEVACRAISET